MQTRSWSTQDQNSLKYLIGYIDHHVAVLARSMPGKYYKLMPNVEHFVGDPSARKAIEVCGLLDEKKYDQLTSADLAAAAAVLAVSIARNAPRQTLTALYSELRYKGAGHAQRLLMSTLEIPECNARYPQLEFVEFNSAGPRKQHYINQVVNAYRTAGKWLAAGSKSLALPNMDEVEEKARKGFQAIGDRKDRRARRKARAIAATLNYGFRNSANYDPHRILSAGRKPRVRSAYLRYFDEDALGQVVNNVLRINENYANPGIHVRVEYQDQPGFSDCSVWAYRRTSLLSTRPSGPAHACPLISLRREFFQCTVAQQAAILIEEWSRLWCGTEDYALDEGGCVVLQKRSSDAKERALPAMKNQPKWKLTTLYGRITGPGNSDAERTREGHQWLEQNLVNGGLKAPEPAMDDQPTWENAASYGYFLRDAFGPSAGRSGGGMFSSTYRFRPRTNKVRRSPGGPL